MEDLISPNWISQYNIHHSAYKICTPLIVDIPLSHSVHSD